MSYQISAIPAFTDNYIWCIHNEKYAAVVDPGDEKPVVEFLSANNLQLTDILITHHHQDHTGGIVKLASVFNDVEVYGPKNERIKGISVCLSEGDRIHLKKVNASFEVLEVPGHTLDHIAFYNHHEVFCGDALFSAGCGRMFEGNPEMFVQSLDKLEQLSPDTRVYCTHEYTMANLAFAREVDQTNSVLQGYFDKTKKLREKGHISLPTTIEEQKAINPFLRTTDACIRQYFNDKMNLELTDRVSTFAALRSMKDNF